MSFTGGTGNLFSDPEVKETKAGTKVLIAVAHSPRYRDKDGKWTDDTTVFTRVEWWGKEAVAFAHEANKGTPVVYIGEWRAEDWTDDEGKKRHRQWVQAARVGTVVRPLGNAGGNDLDDLDDGDPEDGA